MEMSINPIEIVKEATLDNLYPIEEPRGPFSPSDELIDAEIDDLEEEDELDEIYL